MSARSVTVAQLRWQRPPHDFRSWVLPLGLSRREARAFQAALRAMTPEMPDPQSFADLLATRADLAAFLDCQPDAPCIVVRLPLERLGSVTAAMLTCRDAPPLAFDAGAWDGFKTVCMVLDVGYRVLVRQRLESFPPIGPN